MPKQSGINILPDHEMDNVVVDFFNSVDGWRRAVTGLRKALSPPISNESFAQEETPTYIRAGLGYQSRADPVLKLFRYPRIGQDEDGCWKI